MWETWVQSLGWGDPLKESLEAHSSILTWSIPMDRGAWGAEIHGVAKSWTQWSDFHFTSLHFFTRKWLCFRELAHLELGIQLRCWDISQISLLSCGFTVRVGVRRPKSLCFVIGIEKERQCFGIFWKKELLSPPWEEPLISHPSSHPQEYPQCVRKEERKFFFIILWASQTSYKSTTNTNF